MHSKSIAFLLQPPPRRENPLCRLTACSKLADGQTNHMTERAGGGVPARLCGAIDVHKGAVHIARLNTAGRYLLTGGADRHVHLWNAESIAAESHSSLGGETPAKTAARAPIKTYSAHTGTVLGLSIAHDNATFVSGGEDRNVLVWDVTTGSVVRRLSAHSGAIQVVQYCGAALSDGAGSNVAGGDSVVAAAGFDTALRFYDMRARGAWKPIMECKEARDSVLCMAVHKHCVYTGSVDGVVRTYDLRAGDLREDTFDRPITSITVSEAGTSILVSTLAREQRGSSANSLARATHVLLDIDDGSHLQTIDAGGVNASYRCHSTFAGKGDATIVAGDEQGCIRAWDVLAGTEHRVTSIGSGTPVTSTATSAAPHRKAVLWTEYSSKGGGRMVTAGADGVVKIWAC